MHLSLEEALKQGANAVFMDKYQEQVRMVEVVGITKDLCGGTHVQHTSEIGLFKIMSEGSGAAGIRRIEGITGFKALEYFQKIHFSLFSLSSKLGVKKEEVGNKVDSLLQEIKKLKKQIHEKNELKERKKTSMRGREGRVTAVSFSIILKLCTCHFF